MVITVGRQQRQRRVLVEQHLQNANRNIALSDGHLPRAKRKLGEPRSPSIVRALLRRQARGKNSKIPPLKTVPYSMSKAIPLDQRYDRVILGFTADGEHVIVSCGPLTDPCWLEFRQIGLQWPGLSKPGSFPWSLSLYNRRAQRLQQRQLSGAATEFDRDLDEENGSDFRELEGEGGVGERGTGSDADAGRWGLTMEVGDREPASVTVTESADGFLVVATVELRSSSSEIIDEERCYDVFVAPGPAYLDHARANPQLPPVGTAFSYIVAQAGSQAPLPCIKARDVGAIGREAAKSCMGATELEKSYAIVVNAVDTIHILEVCLHTGGRRVSSDEETNTTSPLTGVQFTIQPAGDRNINNTNDEGTPNTDLSGQDRLIEDSKPTARAGDAVSVDDDSSPSASANDDHRRQWWAVGSSLPSTSRIITRPLGGRRRPPPSVRTAASTPAGMIAPVFPDEGVVPSIARVGGNSATSATRNVPGIGSHRYVGGISGQGNALQESEASSNFRAEIGPGRTGEERSDHGAEQRRQRSDAACVKRGRARASVDKDRQCLFDLEAFISELLCRPEAFSDRGLGDTEDDPRGAKEARMANDASKLLPVRDTGNGRSAGPKAVAMDYHCVTVGLLEGERRVLLCLVIKVMYTHTSEFDQSSRRESSSARGRQNLRPVSERELLGFVLALDLRSGEVSILTKRSEKDNGVECSRCCGALAWSVQRSGAYPLARIGRRITNAAVIQGRSLSAIANPVYPVAIVRDE